MYQGIERTRIHRVILELLKAKISRAISLVSDARQSMTWKQRSVAKKHGWGAANAMSLLFQRANLDESALFEEYFGILRLLMVCVETVSEVNDKIALSAMTAIRSLPPPQLSKLADRSGLVGDGIGLCILRLYSVRVHKDLSVWAGYV
jgi:hypothetical protein